VHETTDTTSGIDRASVDRWLGEHVRGATAPFRFRLIAGGRSNLTYEVVGADGHRFVLRRPPLGNVLQSAHDMGREHRIISALAPTAVPVATALAHCDDVAVTGAPFYVMEFVDGAILRTEQDAEAHFDPAGRAAIGRSLVDVLADLHALDPDEVGLGTLGRKEGYVERQLRRWHTQFQNSKDRDVPVVDEVHRRLAAHVPAQQRTSIVHGDFRLDNCMIGPDGRVRAVLDWELCTLGDPLADLGLLVVYWAQQGDEPWRMLTGRATSAPGFPTREEIAARYAERSDLDTSELHFYVALGFWKLACIYEGIRARYGAGVMGEDGFSVDHAREQVDRLGHAALRHAERLR
jgi:aminoglycoside phosphotransferase (APT) family kinase protein